MGSFPVGLLIGIALSCIMTWISGLRRGSVAHTRSDRDALSFTTNMSMEATVKTILQSALESGYSIEDISDDGYSLVLSTPLDLWHVGFFFPIAVYQGEQGTTIVDVGIAGRRLGLNFFRNPHLRCFHTLKAGAILHSDDCS